MVDTVREKRLSWFEHVQWRDGELARWEEEIQEPGKPQRRLMELVKEDMQRVEVTEVDAGG